MGFGLGGPEIGVARPQFADIFARARAIGLHSVPHAGETTGPQTIWDAIHLLGAERIGHGTSAAQDPELLAHLAEHPLPALVAAGVPVSISSDDPPMFSTDLNREYGKGGKDRNGIYYSCPPGQNISCR